MGFLQMKGSLELYTRTARALNAFFDRWAAASCVRCFDLCKEAYPDDNFSKMELKKGIFPGCCQAGVAEDFRVMDTGEPLPDPLVAAIRSERQLHIQKNEASRAVCYTAMEFTLLESDTSELKTGVGCKWLREGGCMMTEWKSPICLAFICEPVRQGLVQASDGDRWPLETDFCGVSGVFVAIGKASIGKRMHYDRALNEVTALETRLNRHSARLEAVGALSH